MSKIQVKCSTCGKNLLRKTSVFKKHKFFFCNKECQERAHSLAELGYTTGPKSSGKCTVLNLTNCLTCGCKLTQTTQKRYCSQKCYHADAVSRLRKKRADLVELWLNNKISGTKMSRDRGAIKNFVREYLYITNNNSCQICGYSDIINPFSGLPILQVHHINGNTFDSFPSNLQLLCQNCHAKTENFCNIKRS